MKKRILAVTLLLAMVFSMLPATAVAEEPQTHTHCIYGCAGGACTDPAKHGAEVTFAQWTATDSLPASGNYYLKSDVVLSKVHSVTGTLNLCLKGHTVTQSAAGLRLFTVNDGATFAITDCAGSGKLQGRSDVDKAGGIGYVNSGAVLKLYNVTATGATSKGNGGAFFAASGSTSKAGGILEITNSTLSGNTSKDASNGGGAIYAGAYSKVTLSNTTISGNTATKGGAVCVNGNGAVVTVTGGNIKDNTATAEGGAIRTASSSTTTLQTVTVTGNKAPKGSAVYMGGTCKVILDGASITGNPVTDMGAVAKTNGTLTLKGSTKIHDNQKADGTRMNLYLSGNNTLATPALTADAKIGVSVASNRESMALTGTITGDPSGYFVSDDADYEVKTEDGKLTLAEKPVQVETHTHCIYGCAGGACTDPTNHGAEVTFAQWTATDSLPESGNYYLKSDVVLSQVHTVTGTLNLCLNGNTVSQSKSATRVLDVKGTLNLTDCKDTGKLQGGQSVGNGGIVNVYKGFTMNLYNGTLTGGKATTGAGAVLLQTGTASVAGGTLNMYGGAITGNTAPSGGAIYVNTYAVLNIQGGTVSNNTATTEGGAFRVAANSQTTVGNATLTGNKAPKGSAIYMGGACKVTLDGASITGNPVTGMGAVAKTNGTLVLKGSTKIYDNKTADGTQMNLYMSGTNKLGNIADLTAGAKVGISLPADRTDMVLSGTVTGDPSGYFVSDHADYEVKTEESKLVLKEKVVVPTVTHCLFGCAGGACTDPTNHGAEVTFTEWDKTDSLPASGSYYLKNDVELSDAVTVTGTLNLCLNGKTVTQKTAGKRLLLVDNSGKLTITDHDGTGSLRGRIDGATTGSIVLVRKGGTFNLYNGTLTGATAESGGAIVLGTGDASTRAVFNAYGGTISGNTATKDGGALYAGDYSLVTLKNLTISSNTAAKDGAAILGGKGSVITLENCTVSGNTSLTGAIRVTTDVVLNIIGGTISGNTAENAAALEILGSAKVTLDGVKITQNKVTSSTGYGAVDFGNSLASLTLKGQTQITGNLGKGDVPMNLFLRVPGSNGVISYVNADELSGEAKVGITLQQGRQEQHFSTEIASGKNPEGFFISDNEEYLVKTDSGRLMLDVIPLVYDHEHCLYGCEGTCQHTKVKYAAWTKPGIPTSGSYYLTGNVTVSQETALTGNLNLDLRGYKITQTGGKRIFLVTNGTTLNLSDCTAKTENKAYKAGMLSGGQFNYGAAVRVKVGGTFNLYGGILAKNSATDPDAGWGGAVYLEGGTTVAGGGIFNMYGGMIAENEATRGGGVYANNTEEGVEKAQINLYGGQIINNISASDGGGIYASKNTLVTVSGGTIAGNTAKGNGGGIFVAGKGSTLTVTGGTVRTNQAANGAGILLQASAVGTVSGGSINGNTCIADSNNVIGGGAGVYVSINSALTLKGGTVSGNSGRRGGGIEVYGGTLTMEGGAVEKNTASDVGGGVYIHGTNAAMTLTGGEIKNNKAVNGAGVMVQTTGSVFTMTGGSITGNTCVDSGASLMGQGGGAYISTGTTFTMEGGEIKNNKAKDGAGICAYRSTVELKKGTFSGNQAVMDSKKTGGRGGAMYLCGAEGTVGAVTVQGNTSQSFGAGIGINRAVASGSLPDKGTDVIINGASITGNKALGSSGNGGGLAVTGTGTRVTMKSGTISGNSAENAGGVLCQNTDCKFVFSGGSIRNNSSRVSGGGIYVSTGSSLTMNGGTVSGNTTKSSGAGIFFLRSSGTLSSGTISGNTATNHGGGIYVSGAKVYVGSLTISGNTAKKDGGGIATGSYKNKSTGETFFPTLTVANATITENKAVHGAGVLSASSQGVFNLQGGAITRNVASNHGGGIYASTKSTFNMSGGIVAYNEARYGAGIYHLQATATYTGGEISNNTAEVNGGGMSITRASQIKMKDLKICNNAGSNGGGILCQGSGSALEMENCTVSGNTASAAGGGAYLSSNIRADIRDCTFSENTTAKHGAGIYTLATSVVTITDSTITKNAAQLTGGGLLVRGNTILENCQVTENTAGENGGGIATGKMGATGMGIVPGLELKNSQVRANTAELQGGGLYLALGSKAELTGSQITGNTAKAEGGGIWAVDDLTMNGITVTGNTSGGEGYAVYLAPAQYDGHSYFVGLMKICGDLKILDNTNGDLFVGPEVAIAVGHQGLGKDTRVQLTLDSGVLTDRIFGAYNYEGGNQVYTLTYGDRSLTEPEESPALPEDPDATQPETTEEADPAADGAGNGLMWVIIAAAAALAAAGGIAGAAAAKKKKANKK